MKEEPQEVEIISEQKVTTYYVNQKMTFTITFPEISFMTETGEIVKLVYKEPVSEGTK